MLIYTEKGTGLHDAIAAAGYGLAQVDGVWTSNNDAAVQLIIDGYTLAASQALKVADVSAYAKLLRDKAIKAVSPGEMASWPIKLAEAAKFAASGNPTDAPMLSAEAATRAVTLPELIAKVAANATGFAALEAQISGTDGRHRDALKTLTTFAEVVSYDFSAGWPDV